MGRWRYIIFEHNLFTGRSSVPLTDWLFTEWRLRCRDAKFTVLTLLSTRPSSDGSLRVYCPTMHSQMHSTPMSFVPCLRLFSVAVCVCAVETQWWALIHLGSSGSACREQLQRVKAAVVQFHKTAVLCFSASCCLCFYHQLGKQLQLCTWSVTDWASSRSHN